ncbi:fatty acid desaturase [Stieleria varia]|uniref:Delta(12)-fatty-acid desaturase n=1 Tax=Stieleria varia TaxID=2528005 RepID=A0A5C5ZXV7_9BACT|nr:fatty acid desaturase [Stieleria varia]TWT91990.1 Delta(12)-fatty-acid desaturase [Stieleria varia]
MQAEQSVSIVEIARDEPITLQQILRTIPRECYQRNYRKAFAWLVWDWLLIGLCVTAILWAQSWWIAVPISCVLGTVLSGLFILGHDAGHRSFCRSRRWNNFIGHITTSWVLWPFHIWRLSHNTHHRHTHHVHKEVAWKPAPGFIYKRLAWLDRMIYRYARTWLFYLGSIIFTATVVRDYVRGKGLSSQEHCEVLFSVLITALAGAVYASVSYLIAGWYGLLMLFVIPQFVFHFWLSLFTLLHHTTPDVTFMAPDVWTREKASLECSIHVIYPWWVDLLNHDISWHVPHHVCAAIPHYNLRLAYRHLKETYPDRIVERKLTFRYLVSVLRQCNLIEDFKPGMQEWKRFNENESSQPREVVRQ